VRFAAVPQRASGSANPAAAASVALTQNTKVSGNGALAICPLLVALASALAKGIVACLAAVEENV
jgi:hypothetical protein